MTRHLVSVALLLALFAGAVAPAAAKNSLLQEFKKKYPQFKFDKIHSCTLCHQEAKKGVGPLNGYGKDFKAQKGTPAEKLVKIEKLDSDKDKFSNIDEIKAGTNPGDPKSNPRTKAADAKTTGTLHTLATDIKTTGTLHADVKTTGTLHTLATDTKTTGSAAAKAAKPTAKKRKGRKAKATPRQ